MAISQPRPKSQRVVTYTLDLLARLAFTNISLALRDRIEILRTSSLKTHTGSCSPTHRQASENA
jgi:hypothetical protein